MSMFNPDLGQPPSSNPPGQSNDLLAGIAPPPAATSTDTTSKNYIGPSGYQLPDNYNAGTSPLQAGINLISGAFLSGAPISPTVIPPRYANGDEFLPITQSWSPSDIASLQKQLVAVGLLQPKDFQLGFWDNPSMLAYRELLGYSNIAGKDYSTTLASFQSVVSQYGDTTQKGRIRQPFLAKTTDPAALHDLLDNVSVRTIGRGLSEDEKAKFIQSYQALETDSQRQAYDLQGDYDPNTGAYTGTGGTVMQPDAQAEATKFTKEAHPDDVKVFNALQSFKAFDDLLSSSKVA